MDADEALMRVALDARADVRKLGRRRGRRVTQPRAAHDGTRVGFRTSQARLQLFVQGDQDSHRELAPCRRDLWSESLKREQSENYCIHRRRPKANRSANVCNFSPSRNTMLLRIAWLSIFSQIFSMAFSVNRPETMIASFEIRCCCRV